MIRRFLDCSTAHLSLTAREWLRDQAERNIEAAEGYAPMPDFNVAAHLHGWWVWVPTDRGAFTGPEDLNPIFDHAQANGADYILFDADAEEIDGLPTHEW